LNAALKRYFEEPILKCRQAIPLQRLIRANQQINAHAQPLISQSVDKIDMSHIKLICSDMPNIEEFLGGYFHQDWMEDAPTSISVVEQYLNEWPVEGITKASNELNVLLMHSDDEMAHYLKEMGCEYYPVGDGFSYREWLNQLADRLCSFLQEK
jgi:hypothetical protein